MTTDREPLVLALSTFEALAWRLSEQGDGEYRARTEARAREMAREAATRVIVVDAAGAVLAEVTPDDALGGPGAPPPSFAPEATAPWPSDELEPVVEEHDAPPTLHCLRPFAERVSLAGGEVATIEGQLRDGVFRIVARGAEAALATREAGVDGQGPYAVVEGGSSTLANGVLVTVGWDDLEETSTAVLVYDPELVRTSGVLDHGAAWSLYFWLDGTLETAEVTLQDDRAAR